MIDQIDVANDVTVLEGDFDLFIILVMIALFN